MKYLLFLLLFVSLQSAAQQPKKYKVGDTAFCGIVFYVVDSGTYYQRGLVCSLKDVETGISWFNGAYVKTNATKDGFYSLANAQQVVKVQGNGSYAAKAASNYLNGDSSCNNYHHFQWYLPSKAELMQLYAALAKPKKVKFAKEGYWSSVESTQVSASGKFRKAWLIDFLSGKSFVSDKSNKYRVRAVKEFMNL